MGDTPEYRKGMFYLTGREEELIRVCVEATADRAKADADNSPTDEDAIAEMKFWVELTKLQEKFPPMGEISLIV